MKAPDKIYVKEYPQGLSQMWSSVKATETSAIAQYEYIRKDALISFLEKEKDDLYNWHFHDEDQKFKVYEEVIDKIKEL